MSNQLQRARRALLKRGALCRYCGCRELQQLTIEHLTPKSRGGTNARVNLGVACFRCNVVKGDKTEPEFKAWMKENGLPRMKKDGWRKRTQQFVEARARKRALLKEAKAS